MLLFFNNVGGSPPTPPPTPTPTYGISANTPGNLLYGTDGYLTVNGVDLGATIDAIGVEWGIEQYYPDLAQARGSLSGTGKVTKGEFRIKCKLAEWQYAVLSTLCGSYGTSSDANSETLGGGILGSVTEVTNVILSGVTKNSGKAFMEVIPKAYVELGNIELNEAKETVLETTFHGLFIASTPTKLPGYLSFAV